ncbi:MAG: PadR family transcriptional regulator [Ornithinimicrobium sp.]
MSIKHSLLALLVERPQYGAALRAEFESRTGNTWPLNVGQVYTTLGRLERDGFVVSHEAAGGEDQRIIYSLTETGRAEVEAWWASPVDRSITSRDHLAIKLAIAVTVPGVDLDRLVQAQRSATITRLQELTRLKRNTTGDSPNELSWLLVIDSLIFAAEAEARWLDHVEANVKRSVRRLKAGADAPQGVASAPGLSSEVAL